MEKSLKILRTSIHSFFCNYHTFASVATALIFPASAAALLSTSLLPPSSSLPITLSHRLHSLFAAANFPQSSRLFDLLELKLSQTTLSFLLSLPFSLTFLTLSQASVISAALPSPPSILHLYPPLLLTHLFTTLAILATNIAFFSLLLIPFLLFSPTSLLLLSGLAAVTYSTITANVVVIGNLAGIVSAMENCSAFTAALKACVLMRGRASVALSLALCSNLAMAATEALFEMRVMRTYNKNGIFLDPALIFEAFTVIYIYSVLRVLDFVISCGFYKSCKDELLMKYEGREFEGEGKSDHRV